MNLSQKLLQLRRRQGLSQEALAEKMGAARQTISKWENDQAQPELDALVRLSELYGVSLDWLVKSGNNCAGEVNPNAMTNRDTLIAFLLRAKRSTYAAKGKESAPSRPSSHDFVYCEGDYAYLDTYIGGECFAGEEAVWRDGVPVWAMNYAGRVLKQGFSGDFLKEALMHGTKEMPYRGPALYMKGDYTYHCRAEGTLDWFAGEEEILLRGGRIYECRFGGGKIK